MDDSSSVMVSLTASNYPMWKSRIKDLLYSKDLFDPVELKGVKPAAKSDADWKKMNMKTISLIRRWIDNSEYHHVSEEEDAYTLWTTLESTFQEKSSQNVTFLVRQLVNMRYQDGNNMSEHMSEFQGLLNQLSNMKMEFEQKFQAIFLLNTLPSGWDTLVVTVTNAVPTEQLTLRSIKQSILSESMRRKVQGVSQDSQALVTENRGRSNYRETNRGRSKSRNFRNSSGKSNANVECYYCKKKGHYKKDCRAWLKQQNNGQQGKHAEKSTTAAMTEDVVILSFGEEECLHVDDQKVEWVIDTGATYHATPTQEFFTTYKSGDFGTVRMGNSDQSKIAGIGDICIETNTGCSMTLKDVRHVPDLRLNLISGMALDKQGYVNTFSGGRWKLTTGSLVVARGSTCGSLYKTQVTMCSNELNTVEDEASASLWHKRLGHMSEKGLQILAKKSLIPFAKGTALQPCEYCLFGKQHRVSFSSPLKKKSELLERVYSDVCGPFEVESLGGNRYFVTFIDEASRKVWVEILKSKDQVFEYFQKFHAMVERSTGKQLKCLRSDNGGEYTSKEFKEYLAKHGIRHERTVPGTPQQNGVAERMNRTIAERVRCMLKMSKLPKSFWGEAVRTACYLINRSPSAPLNFEIPEKIWLEKDVSYSYLRVFGCKAFAHIPKEHRTKLEDKATPCILVGYGDPEFGYRLWNPESKKIFRSRDVVFHESQNYENFGSTQQPRQARNPDTLEDEGDDMADDEAAEQGELPPQPEAEETQPRRSTRERRPSGRYLSSEYILIADEGEPETFEEVKSHKESNCWLKAMQEEMDSLNKNETYELTTLPRGRKALRNKRVFKVKRDDEKLVKYKARLVVKGFAQKEGIDFDEIFSPVVKMTSIRTVLGLAASMDLELEQLDVKTAFLHGDLKEEIYMHQPEGFEVKGKEHMVCKLKKSLYGLKQAPRQWYKKFDSFMRNHKFKRTASDHCAYVQRFPNGNFIILLLYVDDMLVVGQDANMIRKLKEDLSKFFDMKDLGPAKQILGMKIVRDRTTRRLWLSQQGYIERVLKRFNMDDAKPVSIPLAGHFKLDKKMCPSTDKEKKDMEEVPYSSAVGSLMYALVCTRPDIAHAVGVVSRYLSNPGRKHWEAVKWILRYLKGTSGLCLKYGHGEPVLEGFTDADMAGHPDGMKSTSGMLFTFAGGAVAWQSKLQKCVALSTTESEYIAACEAGKELVWLKRFLQELGQKQDNFELYCDSQSAIDLSKNATCHSRTKHINVRYHWLREQVEDGVIQIEKIHTDKNPADMMTKVVPREKLELCKQGAGMECK